MDCEGVRVQVLPSGYWKIILTSSHDRKRIRAGWYDLSSGKELHSPQIPENFREFFSRIIAEVPMTTQIYLSVSAEGVYSVSIKPHLESQSEELAAMKAVCSVIAREKNRGLELVAS
jgi:hypothetical protein